MGSCGRLSCRVLRVLLGFALVSLSGSAFARPAQDAGPAAEMEALVRRAMSASPEERAEIVAEIAELGELFAEGAADRPEEALAASRAFAFLAEEAVREAVDLEAALELSRRAFELSPEQAMQREFRLLHTGSRVAGLHWQQGRSERAILVLRELLHGPTQAAGARVFALAVLADFERHLAEWDASERHALEAWNLLADIQRAASEIAPLPPAQAQELATYHSLQRAVAGVLARLYFELGLFDIASEWCLRHEDLLALATDEASRLDATLLRGTRRIYEGRIDSAANELRSALGDEKLRDPYSRARMSLLLCDALAELVAASPASTPALAKEAGELLDQCLDQPELSNADRLEAHILQARFAMVLGDFARANEFLAGAEALARGSGAAGSWTNRSLPYVLALRARSARLASRRVPEEPTVRSSLEQAFEDLTAQWQKVPQRPGGVGLLHFVNKREVLSELLTWTLGNEAEPDERSIDRCLRLISRAQVCGSLSTRLNATEVGLAELRSEMLGPRDGVLVLVPEPDRTHAFVVGKDFARHRYLRVRQADLIADALELSARVSDAQAAIRGSAGWKPSAERLATALFPEELRKVLDRIDGLAVVGVDLIGDPPLETLPMVGGGTLGTRWAVSSLPSLPAGVALARRAARCARQPALDLWLLAATGTGSADGRPPIPLDEAMRQRLLEPFKPERRRVCDGSQATRARLAEADFGHAAIGCILAHGVRDSSRERSAGLQLVPDTTVEGDTGELWCEDIDLTLATVGCPRVVVLATCSAARGAQRTGDDGLGHLGGAFLAGGARSVVVARHDVELAATRTFLEKLHERLAAGDSVQEAMRRARAALSEDPRTAHPFYSGAFQLIGYGQRPVL